MNKASFLKCIDNLLGRVAVSISPPARTGQACKSVDSILIIRPGGIGDAILLFPTIDRIRSAFPGARITVLAEQRNAAAFDFTRSVDRILLYDTPSGLLSALSGRYDVVIDTEQWYRLSAVIARLCGGKISIGFATNERRHLFTHPVEYLQAEYERDTFFRLLGPLHVAGGESCGVPWLHVPDDALRKAENNLPAPFQKCNFVVFFPGASLAEKQWGREKFRVIAERLHARGVAVVIVGGKAEMEEGDRIISGVTGLNLAGKTSLAETGAVIKSARMVLTSDSGVLHIAAGLGIPTVSLFGPSPIQKWAPLGSQHIALSASSPCAPCSRYGSVPPCSLRNVCMADISVDQVYEAVCKLLTRSNLHKDIQIA